MKSKTQILVVDHNIVVDGDGDDWAKVIRKRFPEISSSVRSINAVLDPSRSFRDVERVVLHVPGGSVREQWLAHLAGESDVRNVVVVSTGGLLPRDITRLKNDWSKRQASAAFSASVVSLANLKLKQHFNAAVFLSDLGFGEEDLRAVCKSYFDVVRQLLILLGPTVSSRRSTQRAEDVLSGSYWDKIGGVNKISETICHGYTLLHGIEARKLLLDAKAEIDLSDEAALLPDAVRTLIEAMRLDGKIPIKVAEEAVPVLQELADGFSGVAKETAI